MLETLDNPQKGFKSIHLAGTNGKGSVSHIMASAYQAGGYKVGVFTSPHIFDFRERIKINGELISEEEVIDFIINNKEVATAIEATFFEITTALAFQFFAKKNVDLAIIETGLGGRLDSTNVIVPELSVITNIGLDHQDFLGDTLSLIAREKAGIIKDSVPVVVGRWQSETDVVFNEVATLNGASLSYAQPVEYVTDLLGSFQKENLSTAVAAINHLQNVFPLHENSMIEGFQQVSRTTKFSGRFQQISSSPLTILDAAHNLAGVTNLLEEIKALSFERLHIVYGSSNDKDVEKVFGLFPKDATYQLTTFESKRSLKVNELGNLATKEKLSFELNSSSSDALSEAKQDANENDLILIFGSFYIMADILNKT